MSLPLAVFTYSAAIANEKDFLDSISRNWRASGQERMKPGAMPLAVSCSLESDPDGAALNLYGACRTKIMFSGRIRVDLRANETRYTN